MRFQLQREITVEVLINGILSECSSLTNKIVHSGRHAVLGTLVVKLSLGLFPTRISLEPPST